jgi:molybdate transport system substrate-binding protein
MSPVLRVLSAGAAQGLTRALSRGFENDARCELRASFMPVGALEDKLLAGEGCDVVVSTATMLARYAREARVDGGTIAPLGRVSTGIAVKAGEPAPAIDGEEQLRAALSAVPRLYVPDPERATAGIHFVKVLRALGLYERLAPRLASYPNGVSAMAALAAAAEGGALGCTQVTEIRCTAGVTPVGALPPPFDLATSYAAAASMSASEPALARRFVATLAGPESADARRAAGFEP